MNSLFLAMTMTILTLMIAITSINGFNGVTLWAIIGSIVLALIIGILSNEGK